MRIFKVILAGLISLVFLTGLFWFWKEKSKPAESIDVISRIDRMEKEGTPIFTSKTIDGNEVNLDKMRGKVIIVNMWASWCGPCIEEVPSLISLVEAMKGDVELIAISEDSSLEDIQSFLKSFPKIKHPNIHIIWDNDKKLMKLYGTERLPESYVLNSELKLAKKIVGTINWHTPDSVEYLKTLLITK